MKKSLLGLFVFCLLFLSATASSQTTKHVPVDFATINAAIAGLSSGDIIIVDLGTYNENVIVTKSLTIKGVGTGTDTKIIPTSGIPITVTADNVSLQNLQVSSNTSSLSNHGIWASNVTGLSILTVTATGNAGSGIALQKCTTATITSVTCQLNKNHGLEIGNGSTGVNVVSGTFTNNGTVNNLSTGGGIMIYADAGQSTNSTTITGTVNSNTNKTAGIYLYCAPTGTINGTTIGATGTITLNNNGSTSGSYGTGGAAVLVFGPCSNTTITANSTNSGTVNPTAGLVVLGTDASGSNSPTNTITKNCNLTGFTATSPAATMYAHQGSNTYICTNDVDATNNNMINGALTGYDVEDVLKHKVDDLTLGAFKGPGTTVFVTLSSGSVQRGITVAGLMTGFNTVQVKAGTYNENVSVGIAGFTLKGDGVTTIVTPTSGIGITVSANNVTIQDLEVYHAPSHGIWASGVSGLTITNVVADANGFGGIASGIALQGVTSTPNASILTNVTATNNTNHGLEIGRGCVGVQVVGGDFSSNGTANNLSTGGGIMLYSDLTGVSNQVQNTVIKGTLTANTNKTAGIYIYSTPGLVTGTSIGQTGSITLTDNGSFNTTYLLDGGAGVLIYGGASATTMSATFSRTTVVGSGLVVLGVDNTGTSSPTNTTVSNSVFTGYNGSTSPAITLASETFSGSWTGNAKICTTDVTAYTNVTFTGATTQAQIEALIYHHLDNSTLGYVNYGMFLNLTALIQGRFNGTTMVSDNVTVELHNATTPFALVSSKTAALSTTGTGTFQFSGAVNGVNYYIVVTHRNTIETWSATGQQFASSVLSYDFTTGAAQAYGSNMILKSGKWCFYSGDINQDGLIDLTDLSAIDNDNFNFVTGNTVTDLTGDGFVDLSDLTIVDNNNFNFVAKVRP